MAGVDVPSIVLPADITPEYYPDVLWFEQEYYQNEFPLITRAQRGTAVTNQFQIRHFPRRPRVYPIATTALNNTDTYSTLTLANQSAVGPYPGVGDSTSLMAGDVLDFSGEHVEVIATSTMDPAAQPILPPTVTRPAAGTVVVRRAVDGTAIAAHPIPTGTFNVSSNTAGFGLLVGNSRDGGEVFQDGIRSRPVIVNQNCQFYQFPCQVSFGLETTSGAYGLEPGSQFAQVKRRAHYNMLRDMERSAWYGGGEALGYYTDGEPIRPKQIGIKKQVVTNQITPTNPTAYTPYNFITDVLQPLWAVGSKPDILMGSAAFLAGLTAWSHTMTRIDVGQTTLGIEVEAFESNLAPGLMIIPCITLNPGELFVGMSELIYWRVKMGEMFVPRGNRGAAYEGDWMAEGAIELRDEEKHAYVSGITGYAAE